MIRKFAELIDVPKRDCIYDIIGYLKLDLCVDIGAAAGHMTRKLCLVGGASTQVVAFEPFPGNHKYFNLSIENLSNNIRLIKKAVSDHIGTSKFIIPSVVRGTEPGWEKYVGYSSVGFLEFGPKVDLPGCAIRLQKNLKLMAKSIVGNTLKSPLPQIVNVETTTIDAVFPKENIAFMKIDVQGAETQVLRGADVMLKENRINILHIEWSGDKELVEILTKYGYRIYDSTYVVGAKTQNMQPFKDIGFQIVREIYLSTGKIAYEMILLKNSISPAEAIAKVTKNKLGWIQTDLIAISPNNIDSFFMAIKKYCENQSL